MNKVVDSYIEKFICAEELTRGEDYEVVSYGVLDEECQFYSIDRYFHLKSNELFQSEPLNSKEMIKYLEKHPKWGTVIGLMETPYPSTGKKKVLFYKIKGSVHFDYAITCGFGVVRMLTGEYEGEYLLYFANSLIENENDIMTDIYEELLMLEMYLQLTNPEALHNQALEKMLTDDPEYLAVLIWGDAGRILGRLREIFAGKNRKVVSFNKK